MTLVQLITRVNWQIFYLLRNYQKNWMVSFVIVFILFCSISIWYIEGGFRVFIKMIASVEFSAFHLQFNKQ